MANEIQKSEGKTNLRFDQKAKIKEGECPVLKTIKPSKK